MNTDRDQLAALIDLYAPSVRQVEIVLEEIDSGGDVRSMKEPALTFIRNLVAFYRAVDADLAAHDRAVAQQALRDAADAHDAISYEPVGATFAVQTPGEWLRDRADTLGTHP